MAGMLYQMSRHAWRPLRGVLVLALMLVVLAVAAVLLLNARGLAPAPAASTRAVAGEVAARTVGVGAQARPTAPSSADESAGRCGPGAYVTGDLAGAASPSSVYAMMCGR